MRIRYLLIPLLIVLILLVTLGAMMIGCDDKEKDNSMHFQVCSGVYIDADRGCFFLIRAGKNVSIDPSECSFYVSELGGIPWKLDFTPREYNVSNPFGPILSSGDRNTTYCYQDEGYLWSEGEFIGFDMPMDDIDIFLAMGDFYEVYIYDNEDKLIYKGVFMLEGNCFCQSPEHYSKLD